MQMRPASVTDRPFLEQMLIAAADWRPESTARTVAQILAEPAFAHYVLGWPEPGDFGVIAEDDPGRPIGATWCRCLPADDPGYGFVAVDVPEISIGVVEDARRRGVGRSLLQQLAVEARQRNVDRLSLSVECDNPAIKLYASLGFVVVSEADGAATMLLDVP